MSKRNTNRPAHSIGLDIGDKKSRYCLMNEDEEFLREGWVNTTRGAVIREFSKFPRARVIMEAGTHSAWLQEAIEECGHDAVVANPREVGRKYLSKTKKTDKTDARTLAHLGLVSDVFIAPITHRSRSCQVDLSLIRSREAFMKSRTLLINHARTIVKIFGERLPGCTADAFARTAEPHIPEDLKEALLPVIEEVARLTEQIKEYNRKVEHISETKYPETEVLRQIPGVGPLTALAFILTLEDAKRFRNSRQVGAFVGLVPRRHDSGGAEPQLRITKAGNEHLRRLLVSAAQYVLGHFGPDSDLKRFGERIAARGGKSAKKRAAVAVARKLSVVLHTLWRTGQVYDPFYSSTRSKKAS